MMIFTTIHPYHNAGFTLVELLIIIAIIAILSSIVLPIYQRHILNARLHRAEVALFSNAKFMERFYAQNARFTLNSTTWPTLPTTQTEHFTISFTGQARGAQPNTYRLQAVANNPQQEPRYLTIDQNQTLLLCHKQNTSTLCEPRY